MGTVVLAVFVGSLPGCGDDDATSPEKAILARGERTSWVAIEPRQCLTNSWEQDWLDRHGNDERYPSDPTWPRRFTPEEIAIIQDYYSRQGVVVFQATARQSSDVVCLACSCGEGHTLYLLVRDEDVETMVGFGYRVEMPLK